MSFLDIDWWTTTQITPLELAPFIVFGAIIAFALWNGLTALKARKEIAKEVAEKTPPLVWLRDNYWVAMLCFGLTLGLIAAMLYLAEIGYAVTGIVNRLRALAWGDGRPDDIRNLATATALLLGAMAAAATLIFQLVKVWITERQTKTAEQSHVTDQINKAVEGLGAEKTVNRLGRTVRYTRDGTDYSYFEWQDDPREAPEHDTDKDGKHLLTNDPWTMHGETRRNIEVRVGAIYALERIAQDSPRDHVQIMEILTAYIRENSPAETAAPSPLEPWSSLPLKSWDDPSKIQLHRKARNDRFAVWRWENPVVLWAESLKPATDIQAAIRVIGRRRETQRLEERRDRRYGPEGFRCDLRDVNLQAIDMSGLDLSNSLLSNARLEGANFKSANLKEVVFRGANMTGCSLNRANLSGSRLNHVYGESLDLSKATLRGCFASRSMFCGADLSGTDVSEAYLGSTSFEAATIRASDFHGSDLKFACFDAAEISRSRFTGSVIGSARFREAFISESNFDHSDLVDARFDGSLIKLTTFLGACFIPDTDEMYGFRVISTPMGRNLANAFRHAKISKSYFGEATLNKVQMDSAFGTSDVVLPNEMDHPRHWLPFSADVDTLDQEWHKWRVDPASYTPPKKPS